MILNIYIRKTELVGQIERQHPASDGFQPQLPWLLLKMDGKVRRFPSFSDAKEEALKLWAPVRFERAATGAKAPAKLQKPQPSKRLYDLTNDEVWALMDAHLQMSPETVTGDGELPADVCNERQTTAQANLDSVRSRLNVTPDVSDEGAVYVEWRRRGQPRPPTQVARKEQACLPI